MGFQSFDVQMKSMDLQEDPLLSQISLAALEVDTLK